jgi:hypothetical protein
MELGNRARFEQALPLAQPLLACPFIPLVGINDFANYLVPILNAVYYGLLVWLVLRIWRWRVENSG